MLTMLTFIKSSDAENQRLERIFKPGDPPGAPRAVSFSDPIAKSKSDRHLIKSEAIAKKQNIYANFNQIYETSQLPTQEVRKKTPFLVDITLGDFRNNLRSSRI